MASKGDTIIKYNGDEIASEETKDVWRLVISKGATDSGVQDTTLDELDDTLATNYDIAEHVGLTMRELFAMNLVDLMKAYGKTQSDLVAETGLSKSVISSYCSGQRFPRDKQMQKLADVFHIPVGALVGEDDVKRNVSDLPIEIRAVVEGMIAMSPQQRGELLRLCEHMYPEQFNAEAK